MGAAAHRQRIWGLTGGRVRVEARGVEDRRLGMSRSAKNQVIYLHWRLAENPPTQASLAAVEMEVSLVKGLDIGRLHGQSSRHRFAVQPGLSRLRSTPKYTKLPHRSQRMPLNDRPRED
jgi:hypothetical protein